MKYINVDMAIEVLQKGLDVWMWSHDSKHWFASGIAQMTSKFYMSETFAIGEKPTSPPRKMIEIDGVRMPAPIMRSEDLPETFFILLSDGGIADSSNHDDWTAERKQGNVYTTEADAIAARDARKLILERAMERAK